MDPVSQILADRERSAPRMLPWVVLAATLHGLVVAAAFLYGRTAAARPAHLPVVSVKLIRPDRPPSGPALASKPRPTAAAPAPRPTAAATAVPRPQPTAPNRSRASDKAMAAPKPAATPVPTEAAEPEATGTGSGAGSIGGSSGGLSLGEGDGGQVAGVPADFHFTYYIERMLALIESRWYKPAVAAGTRARVRFRIQRDGRLDTIEIEESSGHPSFDRAALRALYASNPLPPLPPAYTQPSLTVHLSFAE
jgi:protein TonB